MANERLILAIGQMERALSRIETAMAHQQVAMQEGDAAAVAELERRHDALKAAAAEALAGIDAILAQKS